MPHQPGTHAASLNRSGAGTSKRSSRVSRSSNRPESLALADYLLWGVDAGLAGVLFLAPYFMGGRHPMGRLVFVALAVAMSVAWLGRLCLLSNRRWVHSPAEWVLVGAVLLCVAQFVPLPESLVAKVSPAITETLPVGTEGSALSGLLEPWRRLSLTPGATLGGLTMCLAYGMFFLVVTQRIESVRDVERILKWVAGSAILMAAVGLTQYVLGNGKFMWVYDHPFRTTDGNVLGSFINRNHFAHFLALGIAPLVWWAASGFAKRTSRSSARDGFTSSRGSSSVRLDASLFLFIALGGVLFAGLLSLSRGGAVAIGVAVICSGVLFVRSSLLSVRHVLAGTGIAVFLAGALLIHGQERVEERLDDLTIGSIDELDKQHIRRLLWAVNVEAYSQFPIVGLGVGGHPEFYQKYLSKYFNKEFTHAESGFLQIASETGSFGLALLVSGFGLCAFWIARLFLGRHDGGESNYQGDVTSRNRTLACAAAIVGSLAASAAHSVVDFVWYIPACISVTLLLIACLLRLSQLAYRKEQAGSPARSMPRTMAFAGLLAVIMLGGWMIQNRLGPALASPHWDRYLRASNAPREDGDELSLTIETNESDESLARIEISIGHLRNVLTHDPYNARAHVRLAGLYLRHFEQKQLSSENAISLGQIGDAAIASRFDSRRALDEWLERAVGPNRVSLNYALWHAKRGLALCPLQGEGYLYLADLCFLDGGNQPIKVALVEQALRVRPHSERVLFAAGRDAMLVGDLDTAVKYWRKCYHQGGSYKIPLASLLAPRVPVDFFISVFEPEILDWGILYSHYRKTSTPEQLEHFRQYFVGRAEKDTAGYTGEEAARRWMALRTLHFSLGKHEEALQYSRQAYDALPTSKVTRRLLGTDLLKVGLYREAEKHLQWCLRLQPRDEHLKKLVEAAVIGRVRNAKRTDER